MFADDLIVCGHTTQEEVTKMQHDTIYLGHPLPLSYRNRNVTYSFLINKLRTKLTALKAGTLSHTGCLVYINSVLASIPIYYMTNILLPQEILDKITAIIRTLWWKGQQDEGSSKSICLRAWEDICQPRHLGGLGIKNLTTVNRSQVTHSSWMKVTSTGARSDFWSSVQAVKHYIQDNSLYQIHEGK
ncbi:hypothetical protein U9M48_018492, partial [Paspalum notatum var. saurae]